MRSRNGQARQGNCAVLANVGCRGYRRPPFFSRAAASRMTRLRPPVPCRSRSLILRSGLLRIGMSSPVAFRQIDQVEIRARVTGFVESITFKDGAIVKAGDVLYTIDPRQYEAAVEQAQGQLDDAKAKVELARRELTRASTLVKTDAISQDVLDQTPTGFRRRPGGHLQGEAALKRAQPRPRVHQGQSADRRARRSPSGVHRKSGARQRHGRHAPGFDRLTRSDLRLFRHGRVHLPAQQPLVVRGQAAEFAGYAESREIRMVGDKKPSHVGTMDFLDNSLDQSTGTLRGRALVKNQTSRYFPANSAGFGSSPVRRTRGCCAGHRHPVPTSRARSSSS